MKRKLNKKVVAEIKNLLLKKYRDISIIDIIFHKYSITIEKSQLNTIKKGETYYDVSPQLNDSIKNLYSTSKRLNEEKIKEIKWSLVNNYPEEEIIEVYNISKKIMMHIRMGYLPYYSIAPECNSEMERLWPRKKRCNIDEKMVIAIKKEFVDKEGYVKLKEIAEKHEINTGSVSTILNFKTYKDVGVSYNSKIKSIKKAQDLITKEKNSIKNKTKIATIKMRIISLKVKRLEVANQIMQMKNNIKELNASSKKTA